MGQGYGARAAGVGALYNRPKLRYVYLMKPLVENLSESVIEKLVQGDGWKSFTDGEIRPDRAEYVAQIRDDMRRIVYVS